ncbi:hypothetical protein DFH09DRAFT_1338360 [Mycena vulgaris]|nr:hypothetical protein DFH09DRAFT_1338360 [Mycena vulgaris]
MGKPAMLAWAPDDARDAAVSTIHSTAQGRADSCAPPPWRETPGRQHACDATQNTTLACAEQDHEDSCAPPPWRETPGRQHARDATQNTTLACTEQDHEHEQRIASSTEKRAHRRPAPDLRPANEEVRGGKAGIEKKEEKRDGEGEGREGCV